MGLYVSFTPEDLGYQKILFQEVLGELVSVTVDYTAACQAFCDTFMAQATGLVPVDTGYLRSTIHARTFGEVCEAEATAEYAQYVEYGTYVMSAQPYFTPAVEAGLNAFRALAGEALSQAQEELYDICNSIIEAAKATISDGSFMGDMGGILMGAAVMWLMFPLLVNLYGIIDTLSPGDQNFGGGGVGGSAVQIIIT